MNTGGNWRIATKHGAVKAKVEQLELLHREWVPISCARRVEVLIMAMCASLSLFTCSSDCELWAALSATHSPWKTCCAPMKTAMYPENVFSEGFSSLRAHMCEARGKYSS